MTKKPVEPEKAYHTSITIHVNQMLELAVHKHLPEDALHYDATMYPMPTDTGWTPSVLVYVMFQPVGNCDGLHEGEFMSPYALTQELVDAWVADVAQRTVLERTALREARAAGAQPKVGVAVADIEG